MRSTVCPTCKGLIGEQTIGHHKCVSTKICQDCGTEKLISKFLGHASSIDGHRNSCEDCQNKHDQQQSLETKQRRERQDQERQLLYKQRHFVKEHGYHWKKEMIGDDEWEHEGFQLYTPDWKPITLEKAIEELAARGIELGTHPSHEDDSSERHNYHDQYKSNRIPEPEFRQQNDLLREYGYRWRPSFTNGVKQFKLYSPQGNLTIPEKALEEIAALQREGKKPRVQLSREQQIIAKPMFNSHGYYWSDPRRTKDFRLLDRYGNPIWDERRLWLDMQAFPTRYDQEQQEARLSALQLARDLVVHDTLILDTETTGVGGEYEEIVELAILRLDGTKVFYSLIHADEEISEEATAKSGITNEMLATSPTFPEVWQTVSSLIEDKQVAMFPADFDKRILAEEAEHYGLSIPVYEPVCLMRMFMAIVPGKRCRLQDACEHFGIAPSNHRATEDAEVTRQLLLEMAQVSQNL